MASETEMCWSWASSTSSASFCWATCSDSASAAASWSCAACLALAAAVSSSAALSSASSASLRARVATVCDASNSIWRSSIDAVISNIVLACSTTPSMPSSPTTADSVLIPGDISYVAAMTWP